MVVQLRWCASPGCVAAKFQLGCLAARTLRMRSNCGNLNNTMGGGELVTCPWPQLFSQLLNPGQTSSRMQFFKKVRSDCFQLPMLRDTRRFDTSSVRESKVTQTELKALAVSLLRAWNCRCLFNGAASSPPKEDDSKCVGEVSEGEESLPSPALMAPGSMLSASNMSPRTRFSATRKK